MVVVTVSPPAMITLLEAEGIQLQSHVNGSSHVPVVTLVITG